MPKGLSRITLMFMQDDLNTSLAFLEYFYNVTTSLPLALPDPLPYLSLSLPLPIPI